MNGPIGVDLDNTLVSYDRVMKRLAENWGLLQPGQAKGKKAIRDALRKLPGGEISWQKLQAEVYGPAMNQAQPMPGARGFLKACRRLDLTVFIVSHKTEYANYDTTNTSLRQSALNWLRRQEFFDPAGMGLSPDRVFFESTRPEKVARIKSLECSVFIDDLEETFWEPEFPGEIRKILYDPQGLAENTSGVSVFSTWDEISRHLLGGTS